MDAQFNIFPPAGSNKKKIIVGRGQGSGFGKTCGRGSNGQNARSGGGVRLGFEGGQLPLYRRLPRRGFSNAKFKEIYSVVNLQDLEVRFENGDTVDRTSLEAKGLFNGNGAIKVLAQGTLSKKLIVKLEKASLTAQEAISKAGGSFESTAKAK